MRGSSSNSLKLVLLGAPGSGKGTQSSLLCARLGIPHISTGDLLREAQALGTRLGKIAAAHIDRGELVPDAVINGVVEERLQALGAHSGFVLDGYPRTLPQGERLDSILSHMGAHLAGVLYFDVPEPELIERLSHRRVCDGCGRIYNLQNPEVEGALPCRVCGGHLYQREDDNPETIRRRFKLFAEYTHPLVEYYTSRGLLHRIDATGAIEEIYLRSIQSLRISA